jgi:hypothetical protein
MLDDAEDQTGLVLIDTDNDGPRQANELRTRLLDHLEANPDGAARDELRAALRVRNDRVGPELASRSSAGLIRRHGRRWRRVPVPSP